jgi:preprotein translocase subunit SecA
MFGSLAKKLFGSVNDRLLGPMWKDVAAINELEPEMVKLTDAELTAKTAEFKQRIAAGESIDDLLVEAFAVVREASKRSLGMRHFDVQLIGGMVLHRGMISEMKTGEGKTLVATLAVYLNALEGKGVHVVTVNDYLAKRDAEWMGTIYKFLGLTVGCLTQGIEEDERKAAYKCDILYGTNNEFGFDFLRDNLKFKKEAMVQTDFHYAIVDEVDSILIDEARTPLIISGPTEDNSELYIQINKLIPQLSPEDIEVDEKTKAIQLTEQGNHTVEALLRANNLLSSEGNLYDMQNLVLMHHMMQALKAHNLFAKDVDYIVKDNKVVIIDEFTGRMQEGRRYSEGLHQALEAKENVPVQNENQTLASVTYQNYFRMYRKLAGMTGTAMTEAQEFADIYGLNVVEIPTHIAVSRIDEDDLVYRSAEEKYNAIVDEIEKAYVTKQPVLVGTVSIEKSELVSKLLKKKKIKHQVLNAKFHEQEAPIIAQAGRPGSVTIATNMAGRGTDIKLGGNPEMSAEKWDVEKEKQTVLEAGGLLVIGTERHESRRIDNQLRGRSGRQGDPGRTLFYLSLQDDLMRIFGSDRIESLLTRLGLKDGEAITHPWVSKALETAQKKVEGRNYEIRKNLLKFDDVMNDQRKVIYKQRIDIIGAEDVTQMVKDLRVSLIEDLVYSCIPERSYHEEWDIERLHHEMKRVFGFEMPINDWANEEGIAEKELFERITKHTDEFMEAKEHQVDAQTMRNIEKQIFLITLDELWKDHLRTLDNIRQGIGLRAYGQKDPLNEYKHEAFQLFDYMLARLAEELTSRLAHIQFQPMNEDLLEQRQRAQRTREIRTDESQDEQETVRSYVKPENRDPAEPATWGKIGRNEPCPCNSGEKYKYCHGKLA